MSKLVRTVRVSLTTEEAVEAGKRASELAYQLVDMKADLKTEAKERRDSIKAVQKELGELLERVRVGTKDEQHEFDWKINPASGKAELVDLQTGEIVETRTAYPHEKGEQLSIPIVDDTFVPPLPEDPDDDVLPGVGDEAPGGED